MFVYVLSALMIGFTLCQSVWAEDLTDWSLEDLMNVQVISANKKNTRLQQTPAATFVLTQEDIRRAGVNNIPQALRLVPGLQVAQSSANTWSISSRGYNNRFSNKLLVMVDGRSVYSPLFGGVFWEQLDLTMYDIERIEVIRGPGATLWGSNAVNGIINIITKNAGKTQGLTLTTQAGTQATRIASARYGGKKQNLAYRIYAKTRQDDGNLDQFGNLLIKSTGLHTDWKQGKHELHFQGNYYQAQFQQNTTLVALTPPFSTAQNEIACAQGGHMMLDWQYQPTNDNLWKAQFYYNQTKRKEITFQEDRQIYNLDISQQITFNAKHELIWGFGQRISQDNLGNKITATTFSPDQETLTISNLFFQYEWTVIPKKLHLTLGSKFEQHRITGLAIQPNVRFLWEINDTHMLWASMSKAVRQPSRIIRNYALHVPNLSPIPSVPLYAKGNPNFMPEELIAYEAGYRMQYSDYFSTDISIFSNNYVNSLTQEVGAPSIITTPFPHLIIPVIAANKRKTRSYGVEIASQWQVMDWWRLHASYSYLRIKVQIDPSSTSAILYSGFAAEGSDPRHSAVLRSQMNIGHDVEFDATVRYVSSIRYGQIPAYTALDLRVGYALNQHLELSVIGRNLTNKQHLESSASIFIVTPQTAIQRSLYAKMTWTY